MESDKIDDPSECSSCKAGSFKEIVQEKFIYSDSCIDPFEVKNARLLICPECNEVKYLRSTAKQWERNKAIEIASLRRMLTGREFKLLRGVLGKSMEEIGNAFGVETSTVSSWEDGRPSACCSGQICERVLLLKPV